MDFESIRPIVSGLLGGIIAVWVGSYMTRYLPKEWDGKSAFDLVKQNKVPIFLSNVLFLSGLIFGVYLYVQGYFAKDDWRGMGIGFGISCVGPLLILPVSSIIRGRSVGEALVAYSISQKMPLWLLSSLLISGVFILLGSLVSIYA